MFTGKSGKVQIMYKGLKFFYEGDKMAHSFYNDKKQ